MLMSDNGHAGKWGASLVPDEGGKAKDGPAFQGVWNVLAALYEVMHMQDGVNDRRLALCALHQGVRRVREATAEVERRQAVVSRMQSEDQ